jgi:uncharacterized protein
MRADGVLVVGGSSIPLELAGTRRARRRGLLGRTSVGGGAMLLAPCRSVHTIGMRFPIDIAFLNASSKVIDTVTMRPGRLGRPRWRARSVVEADAGSFAVWGLRPGVAVEVRR